MRALDDLPPAAVLLVFIEIVQDLACFCGKTLDPTILARLDDPVVRNASTGALCERFEQCLQDWFAGLPPGALVPAVQARRVADYIDQHFAERITLERLNDVAGWDGRLLETMFKATMGMSIRAYIEKTRIAAAAERLRRGDKVESVGASVGWRGRSNFFHAFKRLMGVTPAKYQAASLNAHSTMHLR